jgi:Domain of unknown function (DUF4326)
MPDASGNPFHLDGPQKSNFVPRRLLLCRGAKFDLQTVSRTLNGRPAVRIDRNSGWENPFEKFFAPTAATETYRRWLIGSMSPEELAGHSRDRRCISGVWLTQKRELLLTAMHTLCGKNIACWCKLRDPCHGDVLLGVANALTDQTDHPAQHSSPVPCMTPR